MLTACLLALLPQTVLVDQVVNLRPGGVVALTFDECIEPGDTLRGTLELLPPSGCGVQIENVSGSEVPPSVWSTRVLMDVELRSTPLGWRDGGFVVGGLGVHDGIPSPPTLGPFDGTLDFAGPSAHRQPYDMAFPGYEFDVLGDFASWQLAAEDTVYVACWQRWSFDYDSTFAPWWGHGYPRYRFDQGGMRVRLLITKESP